MKFNFWCVCTANAHEISKVEKSHEASRQCSSGSNNNISTGWRKHYSEFTLQWIVYKKRVCLKEKRFASVCFSPCAPACVRYGSRWILLMKRKWERSHQNVQNNNAHSHWLNAYGSALKLRFNQSFFRLASFSNSFRKSFRFICSQRKKQKTIEEKKKSAAQFHCLRKLCSSSCG